MPGCKWQDKAKQGKTKHTINNNNTRKHNNATVLAKHTKPKTIQHTRTNKDLQNKSKQNETHENNQTELSITKIARSTNTATTQDNTPPKSAEQHKRAEAPKENKAKLTRQAR